MDLSSKDRVISMLCALNIGPTTKYEVIERMRGVNAFRGVFASFGATKVCLIFPDLPYVIKWSYQDCGSTIVFDEAMQEVDIYNKAVKAGLGMIFPETIHFATINGINFIAQQRIDYSEHSMPYSERERIYQRTETIKCSLVTKVRKDMNQGQEHPRDISDLWISMLLLIYGKRITKALCKFVVKNHIDDLHEQNIGYLNKRPVILDFSGYSR